MQQKEAPIEAISEYGRYGEVLKGQDPIGGILPWIGEIRHGKFFILNCTRNLRESSLQFKHLCTKMIDVVSNVFVDISDYIDKKIELISCYDSYFSDTLLHNIKGLAAYRAQMTNSKYAEAFECKWRTI